MRRPKASRDASRRSLNLFAAGAVAMLALLVPVAVRAQVRSNIVALEVEPSAYASVDDLLARAQVARAFYGLQPDDYDFLIVFPTFESDLGGPYVAGVHRSVAGLGSLFGGSRLQGYVDMRTLMPSGGGIHEQAVATALHELAHQWLAYARFKDRSTGAIRADLLGYEQAHWSFYLSSEGSLMYGSAWKDNHDGTFTAEYSRSRYSTLDLYLMGLVPAAEVPPFQLLHPGPGVSYPATELPPPDGFRMRATAETVTVEDVIAAQGPRVPDSTVSQKVFRAAIVLLVPPGVPPTPEQVAWAESVRVDVAQKFFLMTRGVGLLETDLVSRPPSANPDVARSVAYLVSKQQPDGSWADADGTRIRDTAAAVEALAVAGGDADAARAGRGGADYLAAAAPADTDALARRVGALAQVKAPAAWPATWPRGVERRAGYGFARGWGETPLDTILAALAQQSAGASPAALQPLTDWILAAQGDDGGWASTPRGPSRVETTARALQYLARLPRTLVPAQKATSGLDYLLAMRRADGLLGDDLATASATAEAVLALTEWSRMSPADATDVARRVLSLQGPDGSVGGSVHETAQMLRLYRTISSPNLRVAAGDVLVAATAATKGDQVFATVTVHNDGLAAAGPFEIAVTDSAGAPLANPYQSVGLAAGASLVATFSLDTTGHASSEQLFVFVDPAGAVDETTKADNKVAVPFAITDPPAGIDLTVSPASLSATPSILQRLPAPVAVSVEVGNRGLTPALGVPVVLLVNGLVAAATVVDLPAQSVRTLTLTGLVPTGATAAQLEVRIDPDDAFVEERKDNNRAAIAVPIAPFVDLAMARVSLSTASIEQGGDLFVDYRIENRGSLPALGARVEVRVLNAAGAPVATIPAPSVDVAPGGSAGGTVTWRADLAGAKVIEVRAVAAQDVDRSNDAGLAPVMVESSNLANLALAGDLHVSPDPLLEGRSATVSGMVANTGVADAALFAVEVWVEAGKGGAFRALRQTIPLVRSGESAPFSATFDVTSADSVTVTVRLDPDDVVPEFDERDNAAVLHRTPLSLPDLAFADGDPRLQPVLVKQGGTVAVRLTVRNRGGQEARDVPLDVYVGDPDRGGVAIHSEVLAFVAGGGTADVAFDWVPVGLAGQQDVVAWVNPRRTIVEGSYDDDRATGQVMIEEGALSLSHPYFSPNGDQVLDDTTLYWRTQEAAAVEVRVVDRSGRLVRTLAADGGGQASGTVTWDGRDEKGRVVRDGRYRLTAYAGSAAAGRSFGSVVAVVDTNRTPLSETPPELLAEEPQDLGEYAEILTAGPLPTLPDESGFLFQRGRWVGVDIEECELRFRPAAGGPGRSLVQPWDCSREGTGMGLAISPDGAHAAQSVAYPWDNPACPSVYGCSSLRIYDLVAGTSSEFLLGGYDVPTRVDTAFTPVFSPDGKRLLFMSRNGLWSAADPIGLEEIGIDGQGRRFLEPIEQSERCYWMGEGSWCSKLVDYAYAPDGALVSYVLSGGEVRLHLPDGSRRELWVPREPEPYSEDARGVQPLRSGSHAWSPDGKRVTALDPVDYGYVVLDAASGAPLAKGLGGRKPGATRVDGMGAARHDDAVALLRAVPGSSAYDYAAPRRVWLTAPAGAAPRELFDVTRWNIVGDLTSFSMSPLGSFVSAEVWTDGSARSYRTLVSLANLGLRLSYRRPPGVAKIELRGTAADANLAGWELAVRALAGGEPSVVARGSAPVLSDLFTEWVPPSPGVYEATLRAWDLAGNVRERSLRLNANESPRVSSLSIAPQFLSPNGDGVQDVATIDYRVSESGPVEFSLVDAAQRPVRSFPREHDVAGEYAFTWDGTDETGGRVLDGAYAFLVDGTSLRVVVDTARPDVDIELITVGGKHIFPETQVAQREDDFTSVRLPALTVPLGIRAADINMERWALRESAWDAPTRFVDTDTTGASDIDLFPTETKFKEFVHVPFEQARGRHWRLEARDKAGNPATTQTIAADEELYVLAVGEARVLDPANGSLLLGGRPLPRVDLLTPLVGDKGSLPRPNFSQTRIAFWLTTTVGPPLVEFAVEYRADGSQATTLAPAEVLAEDLVVWDASQVANGSYDARVRAVDALGRVFYSEYVRLHAAGILRISACVQFEPERINYGLDIPLHDRRRPSMDWPPAGSRIELVELGAYSDVQLFADPSIGKVVASVAIVPDAFSPNADGLTWGAGFPLPTAELPECVYWSRVVDPWGGPLWGTLPWLVDLCSPRVVRQDVQDGKLQLVLGENFRTPVRGVAVYLRDAASPQWNAVAAVPAFSRTSAPVTVDLGPAARCNRQDIRLVARVDGRDAPVDTEHHPDFSSCGPLAKQVEERCSTLTVTEPVRDGVAPYCTPHVPTFRNQVRAESPNGNVSRVQAGLTPITGVEPVVAYAAAASGPRVTVDVEYQSAGLREGLYLATATAWDDSGTLRKTLPPEQATIVDRTPPVVAVTAPANGAHVCPVERRGADGRVRLVVPVEGSVTDDHLEALTMLVGPAGGTATAQSARRFSPYVRTMLSGPLDEVEATGLAPGDYDLVVDARDASGGSVCAPPIRFTLDGAGGLKGMDVSPALFSPDDDGILDLATVRLELLTGAELTIAAQREGASFTALQGSYPAGATEIQWDGTAGGVPLPDGTYTLVATATDPCGRSGSESVPVTIDRTPPVARIDAPAGEAVGAALVVTGEATDEHLERYRLLVGVGADPAELVPVLTSTEPQTGILGGIATGSFAPGLYTVRLEVTDRAGHRREATSTFQVAPSSLVAGLAVTPDLVSPNGDGVLDEAVATVALSAPADAALELVDAAGARVRLLQPVTSWPAGAANVRLGAAALVGVTDGAYAVRLVATAGALSEKALAPLAVDLTPPVLTFQAPAQGAWIAGAADVVASARDEHLASWQLSLERVGGASSVIAAGADPAGAVAAALRSLPDGAYALHLEARDRAGNPASRSVSFTSDATPPVVAFAEPLDGAFVSGRGGPVPVVATLAEANLDTLVLEVVTAAGARELFRGKALPDLGLLARWNVAAEDDGTVTLRLRAVDRAGNVGSAEIQVTVDNKPPEVALDAAPGGFLPAGGAISGTAFDANLVRYTLELSDGPEASADRFVTFATGDHAVQAGVLGALAAPPADGTYTVRVVAVDRAGNSATARRTFRVDTQPPLAPLALTATVQRPRDVRLDWSASASPDTVGYRVFRASGQEPLSAITASPVPGLTLVDSARPDGTYRYAVLAVDGAGLESPRSPEATVTIDATPPVVAIAAPAAADRVSGRVVVQGSAYGTDDLREYRLSWGPGSAPAAFSELARSSVPVFSGPLGAVDTTPLPSGTLVTLRLEAEDLAGNRAATQVTVEVDNTAPGAPTLVSVTPSGRDIAVVWTPPPDTDLAGYLLFRNGAIANAPGDASFADYGPFLIPAGTTSFTDRDLGDGTYAYRVEAVDRSGNLGPLSNTLSATLENGAPSAWIAAPAALSRLTGRVDVIAETNDLDVAQVQLQVRVGSGAFQPLGAPRTEYPYRATLDPASIGSTILELRAVATDGGGRTDPAPRSSFVFFDPDLQPVVVAAHVDGDTAEIAWTDPNPADRVAGYRAARDGGSIDTWSPLPAAVASASSTAAGTPRSAFDGDYWNTRWGAGAGAPQSWQVVWPTPVLLRGATAYLTSPSTIVLWARVAGTWVALEAPQALADPQPVHDLRLGAPLVVDAVKVQFLTAPSGSVGLWEVGVDAEVLSREHARSDAWLALGDHRYQVTAVGLFGQEVLAEAGAHVWQPSLTGPDVSVAPAASLEGAGAGAGARVELLSGGTPVATAAAGAEGRFTFTSAPLALGSNELAARASDAAGNRSLPSDPISVLYDPTPGVAVALRLVGVAGGNVQLGFDLSGDLAGVDHLELTRGAPDAVVARTAADAAGYLDAGLRDGTYTYVLAACNAHGACGAPSNAVTAVVSTPPPPAPHDLVVSAPPDGDRLQLSWAYEGPAGRGFLVERARAAGGPFEPVNAGLLAASTSYLDVGLGSGVTYWYRVEAIDARGNPSAPSNVASGTPVDITPPPPPRIFAPTVAGAPITVGDPITTVKAFSELGTTVELFQNGAPVARARADQLRSLQTPVATLEVPGGPVRSSADGKRLVYLAWRPGSWKPDVAAEDVASRQIVWIGDPNVYVYDAVPSPDGRWVALQGYSYADWRSHVWVAPADTGAPLRMLSAAGRDTTSELAWSADSTRLAFMQLDASGASWGWAVWIAEVATGLASPLAAEPGANALSPAWRGEDVAVRVEPTDGVSPVALRLYPSDGGPYRQPYSAPGLSAFALAPADGPIAVAAGGGQPDVFLVDVATGAARRVTNDPASESSLAFSPDGGTLAFLSDGTLAIHDVAKGTTLTVDAIGAGALTWTASGLVFYDFAAGTSATLGWGGYVEFPSVLLARGANAFSAVAIDGVGLRSPPSLPIEVFLDASALADLALTAAVQPGIPIRGEPVNALVMIRNVGAAPAASPVLAVAVLASDGSIRSAREVVLCAIGPGESVSAAVPLDVAGLSGPQQLSAVVDPAGVIPDPDRTNNRAVVPFQIADNRALALSVAAVPAEVGAGGTSVATVSLANPGGERPVTIRVSLRDPAGLQVMALAPDEVFAPLAGGAAATFQRPIAVGTTAPGAYRVVAEAFADGASIAVASAPLTVQADRTTALSLVSLRASWFTDEPVSLEGTVRNQSSNAILSGATYELTLRDSYGVEVRREVAPLSPILPGGGVRVPTEIAALGGSPGEYLAAARVLLGDRVLATAAAPVSLVGRSRLRGELALDGAAGGPPPAIPSGRSGNAHFAVAAAGGAASTGVVARVAVVDARALTAMVAGSLEIGLLPPGEAAAAELPFDTGGWPLGEYVLSLRADHDGVLDDPLATLRFRVADARPPALQVLNLSAGMFVRGVVSPVVRALDDSSGTAEVRVALDGAAPAPLAWSSGTALDSRWGGTFLLGADGPHELVFTARDQEGNDGLLDPAPDNPTTVMVVSDTIPPIVRIEGVQDGALYASEVTPVVVALDENLALARAWLGDQPFESGAPVGAEGDQVLSAVAVDRAANQSSAVVRFTIDRTPPAITVFGVVDGEYLAADAQPLVEVADAHPGGRNITLDGVPFENGLFVVDEGPHRLEVEAWDLAGNRSTRTVAFTLDKTPPTVALTGFDDGAFVAGAIVPGFVAADTNLLASWATLDGAPLPEGSTVGAEGEHRYTATALDRAGNVGERTGVFTIDRTRPAITIAGVADGDFVNHDVVPTVSVTDLHLASSKVTLDGVPFESGTAVVAEGAHVLAVEAVDRAGNRAAESRRFTIDRTPPVVTVAGIPGPYAPNDVTPVVTVTDANLRSDERTLDGAPWAGTPVVVEGPHALRVVATDLAGNRTDREERFVLDKTPPVVVIHGFSDGETTRRDVEPSYEAIDANLDSSEATLDGVPFVPGTVVQTEGQHLFSVSALDRAGHRTAVAWTFIIDRTVPSVWVEGCDEGRWYATDLLVRFGANEGTLQAVLDGVPVQPGTRVTVEGMHRLQVTATDPAGNAATVTRTCTLDKTPPQVAIDGASDGQFVSQPVRPTVRVTDASPTTVAETLDGQPFASGDLVSAEGRHALSATATDRAGNQGTASLSFVVDLTPPAITVVGVVDGGVYRSPVTPSVTISDDWLATSAVKLDGVTFEPGAVVSTAGHHVLTAHAVDRAGNVADRTISFDLVREGLDVKVEKSLAAGDGRVLALLRSGTCALGAGEITRVRGFLERWLGGPERVLAVDTDEGTFLAHLRSGEYDTFVLVSLSSPDRKCGEQGEGPDPLPSDGPAALVRKAIARELTELVHSGRAGVVSIRTRPENLPKFRELMGLDLDGYSSASGVGTFRAPLEHTPDLSLAGSPSVRLKLDDATSDGQYRGCVHADPAAAVHALGKGWAITLGFDPSRVAEQAEAGALLRQAVAAVVPAVGPADPLGTAAVEIRLTADTAASLVVTEQLEAPVRALLAVPSAAISGSGSSIDWSLSVAADEPRVLRYLARLPGDPGSYTVVTDVSVPGAQGPVLLGSYPLELVVTRTQRQLVLDARAAVAGLDCGHDSVIARRVQAALDGVELRIVSSPADAERNIADLLSAVADVKTLHGSDPTAARLALDDLIRYWEARWFLF